MALALRPSLLHSCNVKTTYSITKAQANLPRIVRESVHGLIGIKKRDETVAFIVSRERMESMLETMEILGNPKAMEVLRKDRAGKLKYYPLGSLDED